MLIKFTRTYTPTPYNKNFTETVYDVGTELEIADRIAKQLISNGHAEDATVVVDKPVIETPAAKVTAKKKPAYKKKIAKKSETK